MLAELIPLITSMLAAAPQIVTDVEALWKVLTAKTPPTAAEQASVDAALEAAHTALQAS
jgi:hypothetical protein